MTGKTEIPTDYDCAYCRSKRGKRSLIRTSHFIGAIFACGECIAKNKKKIIAKPGFIYMIGHDEFWKVGRTCTSPEFRMKELQCGNPNTLRIAGIKLVNDCFIAELLYHKRLEQFHFRGEWFRGEEETIKSIIGLE